MASCLARELYARCVRCSQQVAQLCMTRFTSLDLQSVAALAPFCASLLSSSDIFVSAQVAAYLLDHEHFAGVPPTALAACRQDLSTGESKVGSLQGFVRSDGDCEERGPSAFPVQEVCSCVSLACSAMHEWWVVMHMSAWPTTA